MGNEAQEREAHERAVRTLEILAPTIKTHEQFEKKLSSAPPSLRGIIYEICKPRMPFKAYPLDWYRMKAAQRAEQEQLPTLDAKGEIQKFQPAIDMRTIQHANDVLAAITAARTLTLTCRKCLIEHKFYALDGENQNATIRRARESGWVYEYKADPVTELCPTCANA